MKKIALVLSLFTTLTIFTSCNKSQVEKQVDGYLENLDKTDTIAGIDNNRDGIRDDIENIIEKFEESRIAKNQIRYMAGHISKTITMNPNNLQTLLDEVYLLSRYMSCIEDENFKDKNLGSDDAFKIIKSLTYNTKKRLDAHFTTSNALGGQLLRAYEGECPVYSTTQKQNFDFNN